MAAHGTVRYRLRKNRWIAIGMPAANAPQSIKGVRNAISPRLSTCRLRLSADFTTFAKPQAAKLNYPRTQSPCEILREPFRERPACVQLHIIAAIPFAA